MCQNRLLFGAPFKTAGTLANVCPAPSPDVSLPEIKGGIFWRGEDRTRIPKPAQRTRGRILATEGIIVIRITD
jgi:hypothetical protein